MQAEEKLKEDMNKFTLALKQEKLRKFRRDETDYKGGNVYSWNKPYQRRQEQYQQKERPRTVSFNFTSSEDEGSKDTGISNSDGAISSDFLEHGSPRQSRYSRGPQAPRRGRGRGGNRRGGGERNPVHAEHTYQMRYRNKQ